MEVGCAFFIFCFREKIFQNTLSFVMDASRDDSTVMKYKNAIAAWEVRCRLSKVNPKLADLEDIARYFIWMFNSNAPYSRIETSFLALKWHFNCCPKIC